MKPFKYSYILPAVLLAGCYGNESECIRSEDGSLLGLGLYSFMKINMDDVKRGFLLEFEQAIISIEELNIDADNMDKSNLPPVDLLTVDIEHIEYEGFKGSAVLKFIDGNLWKVRFYPVDFSGFLQTIDLNIHDYIGIRPHVVVRINSDSDYPSYSNYADYHDDHIVWEDNRLSCIYYYYYRY